MYFVYVGVCEAFVAYRNFQCLYMCLHLSCFYIRKFIITDIVNFIAKLDEFWAESKD